MLMAGDRSGGCALACGDVRILTSSRTRADALLVIHGLPIELSRQGIGGRSTLVGDEKQRQKELIVSDLKSFKSDPVARLCSVR